MANIRPAFFRRRSILAMAATLPVSALGVGLGVRPTSPPDPLRIGYADEAPYAFINANGQPTGEAPEVARLVASRLGVRHVDWFLLPFSNLLSALDDRHIDIIAAGMFVTPQRRRRVQFSRPTLLVRSALLVRRGNPLSLCSYRDLENRGRVTAIEGAVEVDRLRAAGVAAERILVVPDAETGLSSVVRGIADSFALSLPSLRWALGRSPDLSQQAEIAACLPQDTGLQEKFDVTAFAFRHQDTRLRDLWDRELASLIGSPQHRQLLEKLGFSATDMATMIDPIATNSATP